MGYINSAMDTLTQFQRLFFQAEPVPVPVVTEEVDTQEPSGRDLQEVAWAESLIYGIRDFEKYNPDDLIQRKGFPIYKRMMQDEQVKAVVKFKRDAITSRNWFFEFDKEVIEKNTINETERERRKLFFKLCVERMQGSFMDVLNGVMSGMYNGFSLTEKVYEPRTFEEFENLTWITIKYLKLRPYDTFLFSVDKFGNIRYVKQELDGEEQEIDMSKFIHYVQNPDVDEHYGESELKPAYRAWFSKDVIIKFRNIFLERMAGGLAVIMPKDGITLKKGTPEWNALTTILETIQTKTGIVLPSGVEMVLHFPKGDNNNYNNAIEDDNKGIAKALLVPNMLGVSEQGAVGARAIGDTQLDAFLWTLDADASRLEELLNEDLFRELGNFNFGDGVYPRFKFKPVSESKKLEIIKVWTELVRGGGAKRSDSDEGHVRELLEFPAKDEESVDAPPPVQPPFGGNGGDPNNTGQNNNPQQDIEEEEEDEETQQAMRRLHGPLMVSKKAFTRAVKRVDLAVIENKATAIEQKQIDKASKAVRDMVINMLDQVREDDLTAEAVAEIKIRASDKRKLRRAMDTLLREGWDLGFTHAGMEIERAAGGETIAERLGLAQMQSSPLSESAAELYFENKAKTLADDMSENTRKAVTSILYNGIKYNWSTTEIVTRVMDELDSKLLPNLSTTVRTNVFEAINEARFTFFRSPLLSDFVEALQYSAIIDGRTTQICRQLDDRIYPADDDIWQTYRPPNHFNCRSILVPVTIRDTWQRSRPPTLAPAEGFG